MPQRMYFLKIFLIFFSLIVWGASDLPGQSGTRLSLSHSAISSFRKVKSNNEEMSSIFVNVLDSIDSPFLGGVTSLYMSNQFDNKLYIGSGVGYKNIGNTITKQYWTTDFEYDVEKPTNFPSPDDYYLVRRVFKQSYHYLFVSLRIGRTFYLSRNFSIVPLFGCNLDYLLSLKGPSDEDVFRYPDLVLSGDIKVLFEYLLSKKISLQIAPVYGHSLTPNATFEYLYDDRQYSDRFDFELKRYSYYLGLEFGVAYKPGREANN